MFGTVLLFFAIICLIMITNRLRRKTPSAGSPLLIVLLLTASAALSACGTSGIPLTATAQYQSAATDVEHLRLTATVARARLQITLDFAGTRVSQIEQSGAFLRANLSALGTDSNFIDANMRDLQEIAKTADLSSTLAAADIRATEALNPGVATVADDTAALGRAGATPDLRPRLDNLVLSTGVNAEDCPVDINPVFTSDSTEIYVVAKAYGIPSGATLSSSWRYHDRELVSHSFTTEYAIDNDCIWFYIDQTDTAFTAGRWTVQISLEGNVLSPLLPFEIVDA